MPNLRDGRFKDATFAGNDAKDFRDTKLMDANAREYADHVSATNEQKEYTSDEINPGRLGVRGHAGN